MGYNIINSTIYAILFLYLIPKFIEEKLKINVLKETLEFLPYILFFLFIRVFADLGIIPLNFWTVTPGVWLIGIVIYLLFVYFKKRDLLKKIQWILFSIALLVYLLSVKIDLVNLVIFLTIFIVPLVFYYGLTFLDDRLVLVSLSHSIDASTTIVGLHFLGLTEKHVISSILNNGILIMLAKGLALYTLFYFERKSYLIASIFVLGLLTGGRNLLLLMAK